MHTCLYAGHPLKQDSFERAQALGFEGGADRTERNGTETERFFTPTVFTTPVFEQVLHNRLLHQNNGIMRTLFSTLILR